MLGLVVSGREATCNNTTAVRVRGVEHLATSSAFICAYDDVTVGLELQLLRVQSQMLSQGVIECECSSAIS